MQQETKQNQPRTPLGRKILEVIKEQGENWISRSGIAEAIGRPDGKIRSNDVDHLKELVKLGLIEVRDATTGVAQTRYEYRYKVQS